MRLQRVQVPNFRVLKDIDITFESHRIPQIFPLASQNGGGKSTLLQLLFTLLTCYNDSDQTRLVKNLLLNSGRDHFINGSKLSIIELVDDGNLVRLDFEFYDSPSLYDSFLTELNGDERAAQISKLRENGINGYTDTIASLEHNRLGIEEEIKRHNQALKPEQDIFPLTKRIEGTMIGYDSMSRIQRYTSKKGSSLFDSIKQANSLDLIKQAISDLKVELRALQTKIKSSREFLDEAKIMLLSQNVHIIHCENGVNCLCKATTSIKDFDLIDFLKRIPAHVFIAAPSSQVFLFLAPKDLALILRGTSEYYNVLMEKQRTIGNLFLYDFSMVKVLTDAFSKAFDSDRAQAIKSGGKYGTEFASLLSDLKNFFNGKSIQPSEDLSRIIIRQQDNNGQEVELNPIDLSHGELRRLAFYAWLKTNKIKDSIVLIDEIEIGMHPDWQYQIVRDLEEWEPSNQYILATHSYEVCSALSPSHVKEIEPKLLKSEAQTAQ
jgi:predicted ATP-binding protein involved in virulence